MRSPRTFTIEACDFVIWKRVSSGLLANEALAIAKWLRLAGYLVRIILEEKRP